MSTKSAMGVTGVCELALRARDPFALARFYVDCFGLEELSRDEDRVWLAAGENARLGLWRPGEKEFGDRGGSHVHFAFSVSPGMLERIADRLRAGHYSIQGPIEHDGGDRSLYLRDPEGNVVEAWDHFCRERSVEDLKS
ncbi:MAG: VOC family protein [Solirubrobacterales bacterium]|nr:VOC family protein [Solirubrobacterales bacterium]